ncbi:MAG: polysaccharide biosynthesis/export family protein [Bacteroidales bacterium]|nr:polysaccharide biosynthesis/export family protein [Bacteroidales bacterium]
MSFLPYHEKNKKAGPFSLLLILSGIFIFSVSCVTNKQAVYVQPGKDQKVDFEAIKKKPRTIQPGDELYIRIKSTDEESNIFNQQIDDYVARTDITLISYLVNEDGYVRLPPIGNLLLSGLTLDEGANVIEKALIGMIATPSVTIKFVNKTVTVLGEVEHPGRYEFYDQRINLFQALGYAGDISTYGNRKNIMILREENNKIIREYVDLTNENVLGSKNYYIKPNDVIYVEPLKRRYWDMDTFPFTLILSATSTIILILSYIHLY